MKTGVLPVVLLLAACAPTLQGVPPNLYSGAHGLNSVPTYTPAEARTNLDAYYGAVWLAHCQGKPAVNATPACLFLKRNGTIPWVAERDSCCLREP